MFIALLYYIPEDRVNPPLAEWAKRSEILMEHIPDFNQQTIISNFLIHYYCLRADLSKAALLLERLKQKENDKNLPPLL